MAQTSIFLSNLSLKARIVLSCLSVLALTFNAGAKQITVTIVDQNNAPVPNAVLSITSPDVKTVLNPTIEEKAAVMDQINEQFSPTVLIVEQGQQVSFPNSDEIRHHVYSFSHPNQFEIKLFSGQDTKTISFENHGVVVLGCNIHDNMIGYIYVSNGQPSYLSDVNGNVQFLSEVSETTSIKASVWHPQLSVMQDQIIEISIPADTSFHRVTIPFILEPEQVTKEQTGFKRKFGR
ncbi:hypothetical protein ISG33_15805 [Glaciecola sp. MH2013]|uniref:hypothetical protein n=1 Tax=Glaciecola sp. MH2013 TaxID=2785524 RepID=UPI00189F4A0A|nr:hypothetical protein [Glaciecola sp. MH2013]MBF7074867.1 hypothetical protein [Glaciecola sp. MH2013]